MQLYILNLQNNWKLHGLGSDSRFVGDLEDLHQKITEASAEHACQDESCCLLLDKEETGHVKRLLAAFGQNPNGKLTCEVLNASVAKHFHREDLSQQFVHLKPYFKLIGSEQENLFPKDSASGGQEIDEHCIGIFFDQVLPM